MRKSRIKLSEVEEAFLTDLGDDTKFFPTLQALAIQVPSWSKMIFGVRRQEKLTFEVSFFEDAKDFFLSYTKRVLNSPDSEYRCFSSESGDWKPFVPPTLIGMNLKTKLRKPNEE